MAGTVSSWPRAARKLSSVKAARQDAAHTSRCEKAIEDDAEVGQDGDERSRPQKSAVQSHALRRPAGARGPPAVVALAIMA